MNEVWIDVELEGLEGNYRTKALVGTGAPKGRIPRHIAERIGALTGYKEKIILADGSIREVDIALVNLKIKGRSVITVMAVMGDYVTVGCSDLQSLCFKVNPVTGELEDVKSCVSSSFYGGWKFLRILKGFSGK